MGEGLVLHRIFQDHCNRNLIVDFYVYVLWKFGTASYFQRPLQLQFNCGFLCLRIVEEFFCEQQNHRAEDAYLAG